MKLFRLEEFIQSKDKACEDSFRTPDSKSEYVQIFHLSSGYNNVMISHTRASLCASVKTCLSFLKTPSMESHANTFSINHDNIQVYISVFSLKTQSKTCPFLPPSFPLPPLFSSFLLSSFCIYSNSENL